MKQYVQKLAIGTAQFGLNYGVANQYGQVSKKEVQNILSFAWQQGISAIDTAVGYGESEKVLGQIGVQHWKVISKLPSIPLSCDSVERWVKASSSESIKRLKTDCLYGLLLHRPLELLSDKGEELYRTLCELKQIGLVRKIGISIYNPSELDSLLKHFDFDLIQSPMNVIDRRLITSGWLEKLKRQGIEIHIRSVFLQGLLLMKKKERPSKFNRWSSLWQSWEQFIQQTGITPLGACLGFIVENPLINKVVIGVDNLNHIEEIVSLSSSEIPKVPDDLQCEDRELVDPVLWGNL